MGKTKNSILTNIYDYTFRTTPSLPTKQELTDEEADYLARLCDPYYAESDETQIFKILNKLEQGGYQYD